MKRQEEIMPTGAPGQTRALVTCPFCGSTDVELLALFGSQLLTDQHYCRACRTPFEHLRADVDEQVSSSLADEAHQGK